MTSINLDDLSKDNRAPKTRRSLIALQQRAAIHRRSPVAALKKSAGTV
ncbi:MAG: hypothetical protein ACFCAD_22695 [Pleurocapsa sp.]